MDAGSLHWLGCGWMLGLATMSKDDPALPPELGLEPERLLDLVRWRMPFGKYAGVAILDLPERYLLWFRDKGFPAGRLGETMALALEVKLNGLEPLLAPLRRPQ